MTKEKVSENVEIEDKVQDISAFLPGAFEDTKKMELAISPRFRDKDGIPIKFKFESVSSERITALRKECTRRMTSSRNRQVGETFDSEKFQARLALESTVYPDFTNKDLLKAYNTVSATELAQKILSVPGDYTEWINAAAAVNGFDESFDSNDEDFYKEEAKN
ncbi:phage portal protein [Listeria booriae]|uniref:Phage portal protein n=1 Tax=Listeria booriae TaxID=1552123 RepID=A0A842CQK7_9LIST|nr:phage portal protein [Listeria booriae]MBC2004448.1 phage portal protein [Listeria booriae]